ncbi:carbohydrate-binding module family 12 protein [Canariomyces notabilis]|uniref:Carbohydrate-binding module family 12 protein n=1 Tax=Canariomyces notabilis TaxID=2074819 RepID=A0AAN6T9B9_9PEZI|nr:carbohydrate-binding module family 12 protein [Canariomyces arenarius]
MTEPLFRFVVLRSPIKGDPNRPLIPLSSTPRDSIQAVCKDFIKSNRFVSSADGTDFQNKLVQFSLLVDNLERAGAAQLEPVINTVEQVFGQQPSNLVRQEDFLSLKGALKDSIVAVKYVQEAHALPLAAIADQLRDMELIEKAVSTPSTSQPRAVSSDAETQPEEHPRRSEPGWAPHKNYNVGDRVRFEDIIYECIQAHRSQVDWEPRVTPALWKAIRACEPEAPEIDVQLYRKRTFLLPLDLDLKSILAMAADEKIKELDNQIKAAKEAEEEAQKLLAKHKNLSLAVTELVKINPNQLQVTVPENHTGAELDYRSSLRKVALARSDLPIRAAAGGPTSSAAASASLADEGPQDLPQLLHQQSPQEHFPSPKIYSVPQGFLGLWGPIVKGLRMELDEVLRALQELVPSGENVTYSRMGSAFIVSRTSSVQGYISIVRTLVPMTKGKVTPSGVAYLLVVKQTLKGYQGADIAHVENVLKGETKHRTHKKTTRTEGVINIEAETNSSEEHELSTTSRFEMSKEASNTIKDDQSLKGAVSIDASVEGSVSRSGEEVNKAASKYSEDVLEWTVKKISERVLEKRSTTSVNEIIEENQHGINNANGTGHISGVYQWLNKVYEARVFNYGLRMMFDFMVPEPAAFLTYAVAEAATNTESGLLLEKPSTFALRPADINENNIGNLILMYQATDVLPPPEDYLTISDQSKFGGGDPSTSYSHGAILSVPSGYEAVWGTISIVWSTWKQEAVIDAQVGSETHRFENNGRWSWGTSLANPYSGSKVASGGSIPWGFSTWSASDGVVSVEVLCRVTDRRKQQWQAETHARLMTVYKARMQEYEEKLARHKLQEGITIQGTNPTANLNTIKSELKKHSISILTAQHYDLFNSITHPAPGGRPEINLHEAQAEGVYVRFFEQAFEWDQMIYITYPYFWGDKSNWVSKLTINDPDPVFDEFLKSGFARVVVPARPGFEGAIDHFMRFGEPWNGGPLPVVTSNLYVPIADELAERLGKPGQEVPQGDPWEVTLPTTLVKLRGDDSLPVWKKEGGVWVPGS